MKYRTLGRTGLRCSEIGLGTWAFASQIYGAVDRGDAYRTVDRALDSGITFFDTAPLYGDKERDGISEKVLGRALGDAKRSVIISTKFGRYSTDGAAPNFHAKRAYESVEGSLRRLGRDYVDVLFFHSPFGPQDIHDDVWEALDDDGVWGDDPRAASIEKGEAIMTRFVDTVSPEIQKHQTRREE